MVDDHHPKAELLVFGFGLVSLTSASLTSWVVFWLFQSKTLCALTFAAILRLFVRIAGDRKGLNRALGDGALSLDLRHVLPPAKAKSLVRVCFISDTHNAQPELPTADVLVHCGDFTMRGSHRELNAFCDWLEKQPHKHKILVCGNHDFGMEGPAESEEISLVRTRLASLAVLLDNSGVEVCGLKFWGSPHTPNIPRRKPMAFQASSESLEPFWERIPSGLDVLITHGPARGYGDRILLGMQVGCPLLLNRIFECKPKFHAFGHIHEAYGIYPNSSNGTVHINCSIANILYKPIHPPIVVDIGVLLDE